MVDRLNSSQPAGPAATALQPEDLVLNLDGREPPLDWPRLFGRRAPVAIEIGTGNGFFIENEAARLPDLDFLAIEREPEFYWKMVRRCARRGLRNARTTPVDAVELMDCWIPPASLTRVYLQFSDPWPKRRHAERRVFNAAFLPRMERLLAPGGELWFKTDVGWYFNLAMTLLRERADWEILERRRLPPPDPARGEVVSNFERKAREAASEVWGFKARPLAPPR